MKIGTEADVLAEKWVDLQKSKFELAEKEKDLIEQINTFAGNDDKTRGVINVEGEDTVIKITRRENVKYDKDGDDDVLLRAAQSIEGIEALVSLSVREKGTQITKIFEKDASSRNDLERAVVTALEDFRVVNQGKPSVKVEPRKR